MNISYQNHDLEVSYHWEDEQPIITSIEFDGRDYMHIVERLYKFNRSIFCTLSDLIAEKCSFEEHLQDIRDMKAEEMIERRYHG